MNSADSRSGFRPVGGDFQALDDGLRQASNPGKLRRARRVAAGVRATALRSWPSSASPGARWRGSGLPARRGACAAELRRRRPWVPAFGRHIHAAAGRDQSAGGVQLRPRPQAAGSLRRYAPASGYARRSGQDRRVAGGRYHDRAGMAQRERRRPARGPGAAQSRCVGAARRLHQAPRGRPDGIPSDPAGRHSDNNTDHNHPFLPRSVS